MSEDTQSDGLGFISDGRSDRVSIDRTRALSNDLIAAAPRVELAGRLHDDDGQQHIQCFFSPLPPPLLCGGPHQPPRRDAGGSEDADGRNRARALGGFLFSLSLFLYM